MRKFTLLLAGSIGLACVGVLSLKLKTIGHSPQYQDEPAEYDEEREAEEGHETGADKQLAAWFTARAYPDPNYLNSKYLQGWEQHQQMIKDQDQNLRVTRLNAASWSSIGPNQTIGGRILSITIDPNNTNNLFVGSASGGIWKSTNAGSSWSYVNTGLPVLGVSSIVYHPTNSNILLAGTGEVYRVDTSNIGFNVWKARGTYGIGILRSADGGLTWSQAYNKTTAELFAIQMLKYDPSNSNNVFACATDGLYKSTDGGLSWTRILVKTFVNDIAIHPTNPAIMVVSVGNLVNADKGIYRTTNGGTTWTKITSGLPASFGGYITIENLGSTRMYASIGKPSGTTNELYQSSDFGATWIQKTGSAHCGGQYWFGHDLAIDPNNGNKVVMGGVSYYTYTSSSTTTNAGTRTAFASGVHADVHDIEYAPGSSTVIYIACDGGVYKTTNGSTFSNMNNGLAAVQFYASVAPSPVDPNIILGGLQDNGVIRYNGTTWASVKGGDGGPCTFHPTNGNIALLSNDARAVFYSSNSGSTSVQKLTNMGYGYGATAYDDRTGFMAPLAISKSNPSIMYVASDNLHVSVDGGTSFQRPNPADMTRPIEATYKTAIALAVSPTNPDKVYVSTSPFSQRADDRLNVNGLPNVLKSLNASSSTAYSFTSIKNTLPDRFVTDFAISNTNDDSVFAVLGGFGTSHVYVTGDGGASWTNVGAGLPDVPFNAVLIDPVDPQVIYAGSDLGVYVSPDRGGTWYAFNDGFWETVQVMDLQVTADNRLVAATHGKGAFIGGRYVSTVSVVTQAFTGKIAGEVNQLAWQVSKEKNVDRYEIERSRDEKHFQKIGVVSARDKSAYNYDDVNGAQGDYFYRLRIMDKSGRYSYSTIVSLKRSENLQVKVYENPFSDAIHLQIQSSKTSNAELRLFASNGKLITRQPIKLSAGPSYHTIDGLGYLATGIYYLEAITPKGKWNSKLLKK